MISNGYVVNANDVTRRYGEGEAAVDALRGVSLDVSSGELVAVMGPSGSGKSTLMHLMAALDKPTSGTITIAGQDVGSLSDADLTKLRRRHIGFVFQFFNLLPMLTAEENIVLPLSIAGEKPDRAFLEGLLDRVGLADRRHHRPSELSGGQQQRVAIARALIHEPRLVVCDEPTAALDSASGEAVMELLAANAVRPGRTVIIVTHDTRVFHYAHSIAQMDDGRIVNVTRPNGAKPQPVHQESYA